MEIRATLSSACKLIHSTRFLVIVILCLSSSSISSSSANVTSLSSSSSSSSSMSPEELEVVFNKALAFASNSTSTLDQLAKALRLESAWPDHSSTTTSADVNVSSCLQQTTTTSASATSPDVAAQCLVSQGQCVSLAQVAALYKLDESSPLNQTEVGVVSPALIYSMLSCDQREDAHGHGDDSPKKPSSQAMWGYSFLFVTLINLCSLTGALVLPCMKLKVYKRLLMFMVALAVGTLAGSGLLFLIPEAFRLVHDDDTDYIWKATTIACGIYLFYLIEKLLRAINAKRENTKQKRRQDELATEGQFSTSFQRHTIHNPIPEKNPDNIPDSLTNGICSSSHRQGIPYKSVTNSSSAATITDVGLVMPENGTDDDVAGQTSPTSPSDDKAYSSDSSVDKTPNLSNGHGHSHGGQDVAPVAYMIIFGDALHNFIDGLSIGSAFTQSIMTGVSVSVAVMCEELPHELGDFAILLNSGMRVRKAILYNFLSACTCYLGTFIGITLGENTQSHEWIFALAGGMFLYISLVDMLPEMNASSETPEGKKLGGLKVFLIHNLGLLTGYSIMLVMALYSGEITFE